MNRRERQERENHITPRCIEHDSGDVLLMLSGWTPAPKRLHPDKEEASLHSSETYFTLWFASLWKRICTAAG